MAYQIPAMPPVNEIQEIKQPLIVMYDTSSSLDGYEGHISEGLQTMKDAIMDDDMARARVELSLIEFNTHARVVQNFTLAANMEVPTIRCIGSTATHEAVEMGIAMGEARKKQYKDAHVAYKQPWLWLLTDGGSNDADNGSFEKLKRMQQDGKCIFFGVAVGDDHHLPALGSMNKDGIYLKISKDGFKEAFKYISQSVSNASDPVFDGNLELPDEDSGIQVFQVKDRMLKL